MDDALVAEHREEAGGKRHRADEGKDERPQHHLLLARTGHSQAHRGGPRRRGRGGSGGTEAPNNRGPRSTLRLRARWSNRNRRRRGRQGANPRRRRRRPRGFPESRMQHFPSAMTGGDGGRRRQWRRRDGAAARHAEKELVAARSRRALEPGLHSKKSHIRSQARITVSIWIHSHPQLPLGRGGAVAQSESHRPQDGRTAGRPALEASAASWRKTPAPAGAGAAGAPPTAATVRPRRPLSPRQRGW